MKVLFEYSLPPHSVLHSLFSSPSLSSSLFLLSCTLIFRLLSLCTHPPLPIPSHYPHFISTPSFLSFPSPYLSLSDPSSTLVYVQSPSLSHHSHSIPTSFTSSSPYLPLYQYTLAYPSLPHSSCPSTPSSYAISPTSFHPLNSHLLQLPPLCLVLFPHPSPLPTTTPRSRLTPPRQVTRRRAYLGRHQGYRRR